MIMGRPRHCVSAVMIRPYRRARQIGGDLYLDVATGQSRHHVVLGLEGQLGDKAVWDIILAARTSNCAVPETSTACDDYLKVLGVL